MNLPQAIESVHQISPFHFSFLTTDCTDLVFSIRVIRVIRG